MKITFLGTGTSHGVPMIGCDCPVCRSDDPKDTRLRASILITTDDGLVVLVDTGPDLRQQAMAQRLRRLDAVLFTHSHADHIMGLDEVRRFNHLQREAIPAYGDALTLADIRRTFAYAFEPGVPKGGGIPDIRLFTLAGPFSLGRQEIVPVPVLHGQRPILGFRVGGFAYLTDCSEVPRTSRPLLEGLDVLVLDALRIRPHPTHLSLDEAVALSRVIAPRRTLLTHMCHDLGHEATCRTLPPGIALAHDGLELQLPGGPARERVEAAASRGAARPEA